MILQYLILLRIHQWIKNAIIFAGLIFGKKLNDPEAIFHSIAAFFIFSLIASSQYVVNDFLDRKEDALHPEKKHRPIASGKIDAKLALGLTVLIFILAVVSAYLLNPVFCYLSLFYFFFNLLYSKFLKHKVILDVMSISIGFVIRAISGAVVVAVSFSTWLLLCTFMLALFWGFSKRRGEILLLDKKAGTHRQILEEYSVDFLDLMMAVSSTMTLVSYVMYTVSPSTIQNLGTDKLVYTIPIVVYAIFRSLYIIYIKNMGHNPTKAILTDRSVLMSGLIWVLLVWFLLYVKTNSINVFIH